MPSPVDRDELSRLLTVGAQLVEVLPREEFDEEHLEGAIHLPLKALNPLLERMSARNVTEIIVTTPDGRLLGVVRR